MSGTLSGQDPTRVICAEGGLTEREAAERLRRDGPNRIPPLPPPSLAAQAGKQLFHFFAGMLWVAAGLALLGRMPELAVAIVAVILFNAAFTFRQEQRAERAAARLRELMPQRAMAWRDGPQRQVEAAELVAGDRVLLRTGDRVPADIRLAEAENLAVDVSMLAGESVPARPGAGEEVFAGTFISDGEAIGQVFAVGRATRLAALTETTRRTPRPPTPLAQELDHVVRLIAAVALAVGAAFFAAGMALALPLTQGFLFAIGVTVALVPEGLLPEVTVSLALGAERMARRRALVRRLESVETLGSTTFICTDKTGTLTRNEMSVVELWTPRGRARIAGQGYAPWGAVEREGRLSEAELGEVGAMFRHCSNGRVVESGGGWRAQGDPLEAALDAFAHRVGAGSAGEVEQTRARFPFDPRRRRMSVVWDGSVLVKGAPEAVLARCRPGDGAAPEAQAMAERGLRVMALARRRLEGGPAPRSPEEAERDLELVALAGIEDRPRPEAAAAIAACRRAGIRLAMITGDHPATARAIAREVGLFGARERVVEGKDLPSDETRLGELADHDGIVLSRIAPDDKLRIANALRRRGHVVAMTGDGANDAPALRASAIGVAMGQTGTDAAREAADLVLLDDNFATIVAAVAEGRGTFSNIRRFLTYVLTINIAELAPFLAWAITRGHFPLALGVLQVLAVDFGTGIMPALALGAEPLSGAELSHPPRQLRLIDARLLWRAFGVLGPVEAAMELLAYAVTLRSLGWHYGGTPPDAAAQLAGSGAAFLAILAGQMATAFSCRSATAPPWRTLRTLGRNPALLWAAAASSALTLALLYTPPLAALLGQRPPHGAGLWVALAGFPVMLIADAIYKASEWTGRGGAATRPVAPAANPL